MSRPPGNDSATIPILMEPVSDTPSSTPPAPERPDQHSLFDESLPAAEAPPPRRHSTQAARAAALQLLRARAPAIIDELITEQSKQLTALLRTRLQRELEALLGALDNHQHADKADNKLPDDHTPPL